MVCPYNIQGMQLNKKQDWVGMDSQRPSESYGWPFSICRNQATLWPDLGITRKFLETAQETDTSVTFWVGTNISSLLTLIIFTQLLCTQVYILIHGLNPNPVWDHSSGAIEVSKATHSLSIKKYMDKSWLDDWWLHDNLYNVSPVLLLSSSYI